MRSHIRRSRSLAAVLLALPIACGGGDDGVPTEPDGPDGSEPQISSITVFPSSAELAEIGATRQFEATARDAGGEEIPGVSFTWTSSASSVATVGTDGTATAQANGATTIEAESDGVTGGATLSVRAGDPAWKQVSAGPFNTCGLTTHGTVYCWGSNRHGQLGDTGGSRATPVLIESSLFFDHVESSGQACARTYESEVHCWGSNAFGELGVGGGGDRTAPTRVSTSQRFGQITTGGNHTCGVTTGQDALCWGLNGRGQLGDGGTADRNTPVSVQGDLSFQGISAAPDGLDNHTCGVTTDGAAYCWGPNGDGELGDGTFDDKTTPVEVQGEMAFEQVRAGGRHSCGLTSGGDIHCWGANDRGQLGDGSTTPSTSPVVVAVAADFVAVAAGRNHACGLTQDGTARCWGANGRRQLGDDSGSSQSSPVLVAGGHTFERLRAGRNHTCGVTSTGLAYCWGANADGQVGDGSFTDRSVPTLVPSPEMNP